MKKQTHYGDSGQAPGRAQGTIGAGCDHYALSEPDIYCEAIADEVGIHLDRDMLRFLLKMKGIDRIELITDSLSTKNPDYTANEEEGIWYGPDLNYDDVGHLAGSHLTMDGAVRNMMRHTGCSLCDAVHMATITPSRMLGIDDTVGSLTPGKRANVLIMDEDVRIRSVFLYGEEVVRNGKLIDPPKGRFVQA